MDGTGPVTGAWADEKVPCMDPECRYPQPSAEPEADGPLRYYACPCGFEFGYSAAAPEAGSCALGVPESVRRALSIAGRSAGIPVPALTEEGRKVFLGPSIGRRPG
jgi:hypothetical protein